MIFRAACFVRSNWNRNGNRTWILQDSVLDTSVCIILRHFSYFKHIEFSYYLFLSLSDITVLGACANFRAEEPSPSLVCSHQVPSQLKLMIMGHLNSSRTWCVRKFGSWVCMNLGHGNASIKCRRHPQGILNCSYQIPVPCPLKTAVPPPSPTRLCLCCCH